MILNFTMMKKILTFLIIFCSFSTLTAQTHADKENLDNYIRMYVSTLDEKVEAIERINTMDSVKAYVKDIHTELLAIVYVIAKVYKFDVYDWSARDYYLYGIAVENISPSLSSYYKFQAINKLSYPVENSRYYKKLGRLNFIVKNIRKTKKQEELNKLKIELRDVVTDLNLMALK